MAESSLPQLESVQIVKPISSTLYINVIGSSFRHATTTATLSIAALSWSCWHSFNNMQIAILFYLSFQSCNLFLQGNSWTHHRLLVSLNTHNTTMHLSLPSLLRHRGVQGSLSIATDDAKKRDRNENAVQWGEVVEVAWGDEGCRDSLHGDVSRLIKYIFPLLSLKQFYVNLHSRNRWAKLCHFCHLTVFQYALLTRIYPVIPIQ